MKKVLLILLLFLTACGNKVEKKMPTQTLKVDERLNTFEVDMSGYKNMRAFEHQFLGVSPSDILEIKEEKITGLFFIGYTGCHVCQEATQYINDVAKENDIKVYYVDAYSKKYPLSEKYEEVYNYLKPVIEGDGLSTPLVFALKDGEFKGYHLGLLKKWDYQNVKEAQVKELKDNYQKLINSLY